jgi:exopolysaccharide biosynthesis polyprenyl glycosylphosphotransferase
MALILALLECGLIGAATCAVLRLMSNSPADGAMDITVALGRALALSLSCVIAFYYQQLYDLRAIRTFKAFLSRLPGSAGLAFVLELAIGWLIPPAGIRGLAPFAILAPLIAIVLPLRAIVYRFAALGSFARRNLVLGTGPLARRIVRELEARPCSREVVVGIVAEAGDGRPPAMTVPVLGSLDDLGAILSRTLPGRIVVALDDRRGRLPVRRLLEARVRGVAIEDGPEVLECLTGKIAIESVLPGALAFSRDFRGSRAHEVLARALSVAVAATGSILLAPLMAIVALVIKLDSGGPVLFVQHRTGLGGRPFRLLKFRTMQPATSPTSEWARDNDRRITRAGRWLRRFRLDELPQVLNMLRGDMNLVGPRPHPVSNFDLFNGSVPYYWLRSLVRPGVTGWAQVLHGYANDLEEETEKMRYDLYYIKHRSVLLDIRILLDTVRVVLLGRGAEAVEPARTDSRVHARSGAFLPKMQLRHDVGRALAGRRGRTPFGLAGHLDRHPGPRTF